MTFDLMAREPNFDNSNHDLPQILYQMNTKKNTNLN